MHIYKTCLQSMCYTNKYTKWYCCIIDQAYTRANTRKNAKALFGYVEGHHILPKFICESDDQKHDKDNIVFLTAREHFLVHWLLTKMIIGNKSSAYYALARFRLDQHGLRRLTSKQYAVAREALSIGRKLHSPWNKGLTYNNGPCTAQRALAISESRKNTPKIKCEYCSKCVDPGNYKKSHGDACKDNPIVSQDVLKKRSDSAKLSYANSVKNGNHKPFDKLKLHSIELACPWCSKKSTNKGAMMRMHFDKCSHNPSSIFYNKRRPATMPQVSCIGCHALTNIGNLIQHHKNCVTSPILQCTDPQTC